MKRFIFFFFFLFYTSLLGAFSSGSQDQQSQALLYKQKRVTWQGAPDTAIFYECYLTRNDDKTLLLDASFISNFPDGPILIVAGQPMEIIVHNDKAVLKQTDIIYKSVVLESGGMMGIAIVNVFTAEPVLDVDTGTLVSGSYLQMFGSWSDMSEDDLFVFNRQRAALIKIDKWPNPTEYMRIEHLTLNDENGDQKLVDIEYLMNEMNIW